MFDVSVNKKITCEYPKLRFLRSNPEVIVLFLSPEEGIPLAHPDPRQIYMYGNSWDHKSFVDFVGTITLEQLEPRLIAKVTPNGEITYDQEDGMYTVWDETYSSIVCKTPYKEAAEAAFRAYSEKYLGD